MKNVSLVLNVILLIAVGFLYYIHFSSTVNDAPLNENNSIGPETSANFSSAESRTSPGILYVNTDSLWNNYELVKKELDELALEKLKFEGQFKQKAGALEKEFIAFQDKASKGLVSQDEGQQKEAQFMQKQQELMNYKDELSLKLLEKEEEKNDKIQNAIYDYLKKHNMERGYNFVLGYTAGGGALLFGKDSLDITNEIVEGLNKEYRDKNPEKTGAKKEK